MQSGPPPVGFTAQVGGNQGPSYPIQPNYAPQPGYPPQPGGYSPYPQPIHAQPGPPQPGYYSGNN